MSFHSATFGVFFAVVVSLYFLAPRGGRVPVLLAASALFYVSFVPQYLLILLALITVDYFAGLAIERTERPGQRKALLLAGLAVNLCFMASFKYAPELLGRSLGVIPIGLSFHTFQAMSYIIEVYRKRQAAERSFTVFALYIMFFPQIAAGPIERPQDMLPQFRKLPSFDYGNAVAGLQLMVWGLFQKYIVADRLATVVNAVYRDHSPLQGPVVAVAAICFPFQILCDFGGYSDIATGAAQVLGFRLTRNFHLPFHSDSMAEYWKRWHISLSTWMRDYVFFPLCGKRPHMPRICGSIVVVFLANGLWHGARWNYLASGLLHGMYRVVELLAGRALSRAGFSVPAAWSGPVKIVRIATVFSLMSFAFLFFRGDSLTQTFDVIRRLFSGWMGLDIMRLATECNRAGLSFATFLKIAICIGLIEIVQLAREAGPLRPRIAGMPGLYRWTLYYASAVAVLFLQPETLQPFIYFRF